MAEIVFQRDHDLSKEEARERLDGFLDKTAEKFGLDLNWDGDVCHFSGVVKGELALNEGQVAVNMKLGFKARLVKGRIESGLKNGLEEALG